MAAASTSTSNPTDSLVAQVLHNTGAAATLSENNRVVKYQIPKTEIWLEQRIWDIGFTTIRPLGCCCSKR
jgi:hypothetical protein